MNSLRTTRRTSIPSIKYLSHIVGDRTKFIRETAANAGGLIGEYFLVPLEFHSVLVKEGLTKVGKIALKCSLELTTSLYGGGLTRYIMSTSGADRLN